MILDDINIILINTQSQGNIGAVARIMKNMRLSNLRLITPRADYSGKEAKYLAHGAIDIVNNISIYENLEQAVSDSSILIGTSSLRQRGKNIEIVTPRGLSEKLIKKNQKGKTSILFGPEEDGLSNEEISICDFLVNIPSSADYPCLNLAQSVSIICYEIFQAFGTANTTYRKPSFSKINYFEFPWDNLEELLGNADFPTRGKRRDVIKRLKNIKDLSQISKSDYNLILGIFEGINKKIVTI